MEIFGEKIRKDKTCFFTGKHKWATYHNGIQWVTRCERCGIYKEAGD